MSSIPKYCPECGLKTTSPLKYSKKDNSFIECNNCGEEFKLTIKQ